MSIFLSHFVMKAKRKICVWSIFGLQGLSIKGPCGVFWGPWGASQAWNRALHLTRPPSPLIATLCPAFLQPASCYRRIVATFFSSTKQCTSFSRSMWLVPKPFLIYVRTNFVWHLENFISVQLVQLACYCSCAAAQFEKEIVLFASILKGLGHIYKQTS